MEIYSVPCLVDAKGEYTKKLVRHLKKTYMASILKIYDESKENCLNYHEDDKILITFQEMLSEIVDWDDNKKTEFMDDIISSSKCDWLEDLVTAVFILHTKILATIRSENPPKKVNINIPEIKDFLHQCFIEIAREIWKHAYLFQETSDSCLYQQNYNKCEELICNSIGETIRDMLPVKEMLRDHLNTFDNEFLMEDDENDNTIDDTIDNTIDDMMDNEISINKEEPIENTFENIKKNAPPLLVLDSSSLQTRIKPGCMASSHNATPDIPNSEQYQTGNNEEFNTSGHKQCKLISTESSMNSKPELSLSCASNIVPQQIKEVNIDDSKTLTNIDLNSLKNDDIVNINFDDENMLTKLQSFGDNAPDFEQC